MSKPFCVKLPNRGLVHIEGEDRKSFLQGLITNDTHKLAPDAPLYACLLTPQGKFLHDFYLHDGGDFILLDCEGGARARDLYERLLKFRLRSKVKISVEEKNIVYAVSTFERSFEKPNLEEKPFEEWDKIRISKCIPDGSRDMEIEKDTLLECGIDKIGGIDWEKGCYVGQEVTARMRFRGNVKKTLQTVTLSKPIAPFTDLPNGGNMRSSCGDIGLAMLKEGENTCL